MARVSEPFWDAAAEGRLRLQWSTAANRAVHYPREVSPYAVDDVLEWRDASAFGTVMASTIVERHSHPEFAAQAPFGLALLSLEDGARLLTRFDPVGALAPGDRVAVEFRGSPPLPFARRSS